MDGGGGGGNLESRGFMRVIISNKTGSGISSPRPGLVEKSVMCAAHVHLHLLNHPL